MHVAYLLPPIERYSPLTGGALATCTMQQARYLLEWGHHVSVLTDAVDETYPVGLIVPIRVAQRATLNRLQRGMSRLRRIRNRWGWMYYEYYLASFMKALRQLAPRPEAVVVFNDLITPKYVRRALPEARVLVRLSNEVRVDSRHIAETVEVVDTFLAVSSYIRDWTVTAHPIPAAKTRVLPNGADMVTFRPREDYLERTEPLRVLFIGRLCPDKGPDLVAEAVAVLQAEGLPVELTVAGAVWWYGNEGQMADPFVQKVMSRLAAVGASYLGHVTRYQVPEVIRAHDVVCVLSRWNDPMPQVVFEAMASGCAVLASNRGGIPEACGSGAMLVDPDDFAGVVECLRSLATQPDVLRLQKQKALIRASQATWAENAAALQRILVS